jgi:hypothetical protein
MKKAFAIKSRGLFDPASNKPTIAGNAMWRRTRAFGRSEIVTPVRKNKFFKIRNFDRLPGSVLILFLLAWAREGLQ